MNDGELWALVFHMVEPDDGPIVADGVLFPDGTAAVHWREECMSGFTDLCDDFQDMGFRHPDAIAYWSHLDGERREGPQQWAQVFQMHRVEDVSQTSGLGIVADGCVFPDGTTVCRWRTQTASAEVWKSFEECDQVHGHGGKTVCVFKESDVIIGGKQADDVPTVLRDRHAV